MKKVHLSIFFLLGIFQTPHAQIELNLEYIKACVPDDFDSCIKYSGNEKTKWVRYYQDQQLTRSCIFSWNNGNKTWNNNPLQEYNYEFDKEGRLNMVKVLIPDASSNNQSITPKMIVGFKETYHYNSQNQLVKILIEEEDKNGWDDYKQVLFEYKNNRLSGIDQKMKMITQIKDKNRLTGMSAGGRDVQGYKITNYDYKTVHKKKLGWGTTEYYALIYRGDDTVVVDHFGLDYDRYYNYLYKGEIHMFYNRKDAYIESQPQLNKMGGMVTKAPDKYCADFLKNKNTITFEPPYIPYTREKIKYVYYYNYDLK